MPVVHFLKKADFGFWHRGLAKKSQHFDVAFSEAAQSKMIYQIWVAL